MNSKFKIFCVYLFILPLLATGVLSLLVSVSPIAWDLKALRSVIPFVDPPLKVGSQNLVYISKDNSWEHGHRVEYGLRFYTFPWGFGSWLVFKEGYEQGSPWQPRYLVDEKGAWYQLSDSSNWASIKETPRDLQETIANHPVLVADGDTRVMAINRLPSLAKSDVRLLTQKPSLLTAPSKRIGAVQLMRLYLLFLLAILSAHLFSTFARDRAMGLKWMYVVISVPAVLTVHVMLTYLLSHFFQVKPFWIFVSEIIVLLIIFLTNLRKNNLLLFHLEINSRSPLWVSSLGMLLLVSFYLLRLDFDGDVLTNWIPVARYFFLLDRHDVNALAAHYGAWLYPTYPPGFPIFVSLPMWLANLPKESWPFITNETNMFVFLYRFCVGILSCSFLVALSVYVYHTIRNSLSWLFVPILAILLFPVLSGRPAAAEVFIVPLFGLACLALIAGSRFRDDLLFRTGFVFAGLLLLAKAEGPLIFLCLFLPWVLSKRFCISEVTPQVYFKDLLVLAISVMPFVIWKAQVSTLLGGLHIAYEPFSIGKLVESHPLAARLLYKAFKVMMENGYWVIMFLMLPVSFSYRIMTRPRTVDWLVPLGVVVYVFGMSLVYVFSKLQDPLLHMDTSYYRVLMVPMMSGFLYFLESMIDFGGARVE